MYLVCPTNTLKGPELNTLNLTWVHSSILWQDLFSYANTLKKETSKVLIAINQETGQFKRR